MSIDGHKESSHAAILQGQRINLFFFFLALLLGVHQLDLAWRQRPARRTRIPKAWKMAPEKGL